MIFETLYFSQPRTVISQECKINEMSPTTILADYLECFQTTVQGRKTQSETSGSLSYADERGRTRTLR